jgi:hypothetical protein
VAVQDKRMAKLEGKILSSSDKDSSVSSQVIIVKQKHSRNDYYGIIIFSWVTYVLGFFGSPLPMNLHPYEHVFIS